MKRLIAFLIFIKTLSFNAQVYKDTVFTEDFNSSTSGWWEANEEAVKSKIKDGHYVISHRGKNGYALWHFYHLDFSKDFEIECKLKFTNSEDQNFIYGLTWGCENWDNKHSLLISGSTYYGMANNVKGVYKEIIPFTQQGSFVNGIGTYNILKVKRSGNRLVCSINDKEIFNEKYNYPITGQNIGIEMYEKKELQVDYIKIKGHMAVMNVIPNAIKGYKKENLGPNINSTAADLMPLISPDGNTLYIDREGHSGNVSREQDIWVSQKNKDGAWQSIRNIGKPLNNSTHNFAFSVSSDNNSLMVGHVYNTDGTFKESGISETHRTMDGWSVPEKVTIEDYHNDASTNEFFLSPDGNYLLQCVQRKDSKGDKDIYVSFRTADKKFSKGINLGSIINTRATESTPFLSSDNKTLYFSSEGHPGYGSADVFVSKRLDDTWQKWTEPQNLGPEINSSAWDAYFSIPASGDVAYMVSHENSLGEADIFRIKLTEAAKPEPVLLVKGKVLNKKTNEPLEASIDYDNITNGKKMGQARSNPKTGEYSIILPIGKNYSFMAEKENFYSITDNIDVTSLSEYKEIVKDLYLAPIEVGQTIRLNNIFFEFDKADLKQESHEELNRLANFLLKNKKIRIEISGHTDNKGDDAYNLKLSQKRIESVGAFLTSKGILAEQFTTKGMGETLPVASNETEEGRALNRRVEFTIKEK